MSSFVGGVRLNGEVRLTVDGEVAGPVSSESGADLFGSRLSVAPNPIRSAGATTLVVGPSQDVSVSVYDALGRQVATLFDGAAVAGQTLALRLDAAGLPAGVYVVRARGTKRARRGVASWMQRPRSAVVVIDRNRIAAHGPAPGR